MKMNAFKRNWVSVTYTAIIVYVMTISLTTTIAPAEAFASDDKYKDIQETQNFYVSYFSHDNSNSVSWTNNSLNHLTDILKSIVDHRSAKSLVHNFKQIDGDLSGLTQKVKRLSQHEQETVAAVVQQSLPKVNTLISQVMQIEGAAVILKPVLDSITSKLVYLTV